jgi:DNA mismatch repair protein MutS
MKSKVAEEKETPLMKQYNAIKAKHPGALLLFRVGDFYETFGEDAILASKILDIVLTRRANGAAAYVELAGFPHHSLDSYLPRLIRAGQRVAICDQLEDPALAKGIVKRGVTELVTPGVSMNDNVLDVKRNNYLASVFFQKNSVGVAFLDISTGEFLVAQGTLPYIDKLIQSFSPSEVLFSKGQKPDFELAFKDNLNAFKIEDWVFAHQYAYEKLTAHFQTTSLKGFGIEEMHEAVTAAGAILYYLELTEHKQITHISAISRIEEDKYVWLDKFTIRNLELVLPQHEGGVPLIQILDECVTPMGARMLKKWVLLPLKSKTAIDERLKAVSYFYQNDELATQLLTLLSPIGDLERLISKVAVGRINPREMVQLKKALQAIPPVKQLLAATGIEKIQTLADRLHHCELLATKIDTELNETPPINPSLGKMIRSGVNAELDDYRAISTSGKDYLIQMQEKEIEKTGISSLRIAYNNVFGYYFEVRNTHQEKVPKEWIRKQTLSNAERYITPELKEYEEKILNAESRITEIEIKIFNALVLTAVEYIKEIQVNAQILATLDCLLSFATVARKNNYVIPHITEDKDLIIKAGRHPVIEQQLPLGEQYVPNDIILNEQQQIIIITGPNMAGKSALLRQTALIALMAQMGSFVPADEAQVGIIDKVFTRVGASDNLSRGESTFMVEMTETASILNNISERSLILMDEIGRGTSTYDGISIAWAIVEYLHTHKNLAPKTLFATHYHELNQLADDFPRVKNFNVAVKKMGNKVIFLRKLKEGGSEHSFGIHVAQMAGIPTSVVLRAGEILEQLEKDKSKDKRKNRLAEVPKINYQLNLFEPINPQFDAVKELLNKLDINTISPVEALLKLNEIKKMMTEK